VLHKINLQGLSIILRRILLACSSRADSEIVEIALAAIISSGGTDLLTFEKN
jgi:hypothetical protein